MNLTQYRDRKSRASGGKLPDATAFFTVLFHLCPMALSDFFYANCIFINIAMPMT
jgi:hypothetical protein